MLLLLVGGPLILRRWLEGGMPVMDSSFFLRWLMVQLGEMRCSPAAVGEMMRRETSRAALCQVEDMVFFGDLGG